MSVYAAVCKSRFRDYVMLGMWEEIVSLLLFSVYVIIDIAVVAIYAEFPRHAFRTIYDMRYDSATVHIGSTFYGHAISKLILTVAVLMSL